MDFNLVVLQGRLAAPPEVFEADGGVIVARNLVLVRSEHPDRRLDVIPVSLCGPPSSMLEHPPTAGARVWVAGTLQRRFFDGEEGRHSRIEVIARRLDMSPDGTDAGRTQVSN